MRKNRRPTFQKLERVWRQHRDTCEFCRRAIKGQRKLSRPCDVERYLYERAERARIRESVRARQAS